MASSYEGEYFNDAKQGDGMIRWVSVNLYVGFYWPTNNIDNY